MESSFASQPIAIEALRLEVLPPATRRAFRFLKTWEVLAQNPWYLAGGTALALQIGHRQSVDLDFFLPRDGFDEVGLERELFATGNWRTDFRERGTIYGFMHIAKMSFIAYPFFIPAEPFLLCGTIRIMSYHDIAAMKIIAISQRGKKRDFFDLYVLCTTSENLFDVVRRAVAQYPGQENNIPHVLKSLVYFEDAEDDPAPMMISPLSWGEVKKFFEREVPAIAKKLIL